MSLDGINIASESHRSVWFCRSGSTMNPEQSDTAKYCHPDLIPTVQLVLTRASYAQRSHLQPVER
jgi:hypothetical protein